MVAKNYKLQDFEIEEHGNQILVSVSGWKGYYSILKLAYPNACTKIFSSKKPNFHWGTFINWSRETTDEINEFLNMLTNVVAIDDSLRQTFALGFHFHSQYEGEGRTTVGNRVHQAKPYKQPVRSVHLENANILAIWFNSFIQRHPAYATSDYIIGVPSNIDKIFDLPTYLAEEVCDKSNIKNGSQYVTKDKTMQSQKDVHIDMRAKNVEGIFQVSDNAPFNNKIVTIIDDIYDTGSTINELGKVLVKAGAIVQGLTATKIKRKSYDHLS